MARSSASASCRVAATRPFSARSTLLTAIVTGTFAPLSSAGDEAVAGTQALLGVDDQQAAVGVGQLVLDAVLHPLGERVARALHAGQVDEDQLPVGAGGDAADRAPGRLGLVGDDRHLGADDRVGERRLADVRAPGQRDEARADRRRPGEIGPGRIGRGQIAGQIAVRSRGQLTHRISSAWSASISPSSVSWSMPLQVQRPVDDRLAQVLGLRRADDDVARAPAGRRSRRPRRRRRRARRWARRSAGTGG